MPLSDPDSDFCIACRLHEFLVHNYSKTKWYTVGIDIGVYIYHVLA